MLTAASYWLINSLMIFFPLRLSLLPFRKPQRAYSAVWSVRPWGMTVLKRWRNGPWLTLRCSRSWVTLPCVWSLNKCRRTLRHSASKWQFLLVGSFFVKASITYDHLLCIIPPPPLFFSLQPLKESSHRSEDSEAHWCWTDSHSLMAAEIHMWGKPQNKSGTMFRSLQNITFSVLAFKFKMSIVSLWLCLFYAFFCFVFKSVSQLQCCI